MAYRGILDWVLSSAGAGWVFGLVSLLVLVAKWVRDRSEQKLICSEGFHFVIASAGGRIGVTYDGKPVKRLAAASFDVTNAGLNPIKNIVLRLVFPAESVVLGALCENHPRTVDRQNTAEWAGNGLTIKVPYLNPYEAHRDRIHILAMVDGETEGATVIGGGEGWSLAKRRLPSRVQVKLRQAVVLAVFAATILVALLVYRPFVMRHYGIDLNGWGLSAVIASSPPVVLLILEVWFAERWCFRPSLLRDLAVRGRQFL
jgi:hypothetical protein